MSAISQFFPERRQWLGVVFIAIFITIAALMSTPRLMHQPFSPEQVERYNLSPETEGESQHLVGGFSRASLDAQKAIGGQPRAAVPAGASGSPNVLNRKLVRTTSLELLVTSPATAAEQIRQTAERLGGYLVSLQAGSSQDAPTATITIRVPAAGLEDARAEIKKLAARVEFEKSEASDVTKEYVDLEARIKNLRSQELQYLAIMKQASTVKDMLAVSEQLNEVRGDIERQQAEFETLSRQTETVAITIMLRAQADAQVFGISWRPLYRLKVAARDGMENLADYAATMTAVIFQLPAVLAWILTVILAAAAGWHILRWVGRRFFDFPKPAVAAEKAAN
jgi:uncharacterized protein DUF4349